MLMYLPEIFFIVLIVSVMSGLFLLSSKVPLTYVRFHIGMVSLPPIVALLALVLQRGNMIFGPWRLGSLSWLLALFVLTIGLIVQKYSVRYLFGDRSYRKYFALLTLTTAADAAVWLSNDLRLLLTCWGATLLGLTLLIRLKRDWKVARNVSRLLGYQFTISWLLLFAAVLWLTQATGHWQLSSVLEKNSLTQLQTWEKTCINMLLVISMLIPSAQWPFQRWLLDSVVAPTPISAVMHAGIVNAGGIMLTRFAPLFSGSQAQFVLLVLSLLSVVMGTGIMLVQVDYKRQLVGSTIAQMGFMLIQCALGAYSAAIIHAVLHGLFKSSLFLQAGSAIHQKVPIKRTPSSRSWRIAGYVLGLLVGVEYWLTSPGEGYQLISALTLGWSMLLAWRQLVAFGKGGIGRIVGFSILAIVAFVYSIIHFMLSGLLNETIQQGTPLSGSVVILLLIVLLASSFAGFWLRHQRSSRLFSIIYLWFVRLGEPKGDLIESHPGYLAKNMFRGGSFR